MLFLMMTRWMDVYIVLRVMAMMGCCLSSFATAKHKVQSQELKENSMTNVMQGRKHVGEVSECFMWISLPEDEKGVLSVVNHRTKHFLNLSNGIICLCTRSTAYNYTFQCNGSLPNTTTKHKTKAYVNIECHKDKAGCLIIIESDHLSKIKLKTYLSKLDCKAYKSHKHSVTSIYICVSNFVACIEFHIKNGSRDSYPNKSFSRELLGDLFTLLKHIDHRTFGSFVMNVDCSLENTTLYTNCSFLEELSRLTLLLKRKCRLAHNHNRSKLNVLRIHRSKRDSDAGEGEAPHIQQKDSTIKKPKREREAPPPSATMKSERTGEVWATTFNETAYRLFLKKEQLKQTLRIESEWAYLCLVFLSVLIASSIWCLRGFHSRNTNKRLVTHSDRDHFLTVKEVLYQKARYLPMFNHQGPLEEVFVHDCGTNTESSRLDMI